MRRFAFLLALVALPAFAQDYVTRKQLETQNLKGRIRVVGSSPAGQSCALTSPPTALAWHTGATWNFYTCQDTGGGFVWTLASSGGPGGSAAGPNNSVQFNDAGAFNGDSGLLYDKAIDRLSIAGQILSTLGVGTAPFSVTSTTVNTNLNADLVDGLHAAAFIKDGLFMVEWGSDIANDLGATAGQSIRRNGAGTGWEPFTASSSTADIDAVGDCAVGVCYGSVAINLIYAGPASGGAGPAAMRAAVDGDIPDTISLTNLTQIGTRLYSDLQSKPTDLSSFEIANNDSVPVADGTNWNPTTLPNGAVSFNTTSNVFAQATLGNVASSTAAQLATVLGADAQGSGDFVRETGSQMTDIVLAGTARLPAAVGVPASTDCDADAEVGRIYARNDALARYSTLYVCAKTGASSYAWELLTLPNIEESASLVQAAAVALNFGAGFSLTTAANKPTITLTLSEGALTDDSALVGNASAIATATALPDCTTGALNYNIASNVFSCNTSVGASHWLDDGNTLRPGDADDKCVRLSNSVTGARICSLADGQFGVDINGDGTDEFLMTRSTNKVTFDSNTASATTIFEFINTATGGKTQILAGSFDAPADPDLGGCSTFKEGTNDGTGTVQACAPDAGIDNVARRYDWPASSSGDGIVLVTTKASGAGLACDSAGICATASQEAAFLADGGTTALVCGAGTAGKAQVLNNGKLEYCDGEDTTPVLRSGYLDADGVDTDTNTTYTADGQGLELSGTQFALELDGTTLSKSATGVKVSTVEGVTGEDPTLAEIQSALTNDFHNVGGTDDDVPESGDFGALTGGRSMTQASGTVDADAELYTDVATIVLSPPATSDDGDLDFSCSGTNGCTITRVWCSTDTGTVTINLEERVETTPNTAGTAILSADLVCDTDSQSSCATGCTVATISNDSIDRYDPINLQVNGVSSATVVRIHVETTRVD